MSEHLWWYVARSGGIAAWGMLAASVLLGLALTTKIMGGRPRPNWLLDFHRFLGGAAVVFTVVHVSALLLDSYIYFGPVEIFVPLTSTYRPTAVAWGVVSLYLLLAVELTSLLRKKLPPQLWRTTHYLSFPLFALGTAHAVTAGTDTGATFMQGALIAGVVVIGALTALRIFPAPAQDAPRSL